MIKVAVPHQFKLKVIPDLKTLFFVDRKDIHYIGGSDILPAPLEAAAEKKAIKDLGTEKDENARKILIEHNLRLVVYIAKKFDNTGVGVEDLISIGTIGLIKAINTFNPDKNIKLATYASRCIENEILMYLRRNNKTRLEVSIDEPLNVDWKRADDHKNEIWTWNGGWRRKDSERSSGYAGDFPVLYIQTGEKDYAKIASGDGEVFMKI